MAIWLASGYSSEAFKLCLQKQVAVYGKPQEIHSDKGSQITATAKELREWEAFASEVEETGIKWTFSPTASPWRNGLAERCVGLAKSCLRRTVDSFELLSFVELEAALKRVASVLNARPITVRLYDDSDFYPVCPGDLLHGRIAGYDPGMEQGCQVDFSVRLERVQRFAELWWKRWEEAAFLLFTPRQKWRQECRSLAVGDVVMILSRAKLGKDSYKLARVARLHPDEDGLVRTVTVVIKSRRVRGRQLHTEEVCLPVQRLVVILPAGESWEGAVSSDE